MANSTRLPGRFHCCVGRGEMIAWKRDVRRRLRRRNRQLVHIEEYDNLLVPNAIASLWDSPGDGRCALPSAAELAELREEHPSYYWDLVSK